MKFIPNAAFERLNSLLGGVDNALGCRSTIRVEAFTCRKGKDEQKTAQIIAQHQQASSAPLDPNYPLSGSGMQFPATSFMSEGEGEEDAGPSRQVGGVPANDRFVFLVSCLNTLYGDEYDFTVLTPNNFQHVDPYAAMAEIDSLVNAMPQELLGANPRHNFWTVISEQVVPGANPMSMVQPTNGFGSIPTPSPTIATECEFYQFNCPECDPTAQSKLWSLHYLIYCKRMKMMLSLLSYGEGNAYRGDDGYTYGVINSPNTKGPSDSPMYYCERDDAGGFPSAPPGFHRPASEDRIITEEEEEEASTYGHKNRDFYGFGGY